MPENLLCFLTLTFNIQVEALLFQAGLEAFPFIVFLIPIAGMVMVVAIVGIVFWYKAREKELLYHQDMRVREMEHQRRMKELELEVEKVKARQPSEKVQA